MNNILTLFTFTILFILYKNKVFNKTQFLLVSFCTQAFNLDLGETITPFFFALSYLSINEFLYILNNGIKVKKNNFILLILPIISYLLFFIIKQSTELDLEIGSNEIIYFIINPIYYYIRYYIPFLLIVHMVRRESIIITNYYNLLYKIALYSIILALFQLFIHGILNNSFVDQLIGLNPRYRIGQFNSVSLTRVNALFYEPKGLGVYLALVQPLIWKRNVMMGYFSIFVGFMTFSSLFLLGIAIYVIVKLVICITNNYLFNYTLSLVTILLFFNLFKVLITSGLILNNSGNDVIRFAIERVEQRYDDNNAMSATLVLGIPLQADLEAPILNYFNDNKQLYISGYGPYNSKFIPDIYYKDTHSYIGRTVGGNVSHIDMGLLYLTFEFGILITLYIMKIIIFDIKIYNKLDAKVYLMMSLMFLFFNIQYLLIISFLIINNNDKPR